MATQKDIRESQKKLATFFKARRLAEGFKRSTLAELAGVSSSSLRRFELKGECSLKLLLKVAAELNILDDIMSIVKNDEFDEVDLLQRGYR